MPMYPHQHTHAQRWSAAHHTSHHLRLSTLYSYQAVSKIFARFIPVDQGWPKPPKVWTLCDFALALHLQCMYDRNRCPSQCTSRDVKYSSWPRPRGSKNWPRPRDYWPQPHDSCGLVVFEVLLKWFVTLTLKTGHFLFSVCVNTEAVAFAKGIAGRFRVV